MFKTTDKERVLLVMVETGRPHWPIEVLADEFRNLVVSSGIEVADMLLVKLKAITPALYVGKGKAQEIADMVQETNATGVIFNNNLSSIQQRNLEAIFAVKTIDRTQLILDIFAQSARTRAGILEVELAQLEYLLPRLRGKGIALSRLGGGIGTRGPGEKKLEVDRRRIEERIVRLKKDLKEVIKHREVMRKKRQKEKVPICSLVGYTNAGKSTLFNAVTASQEKTSSGLFTTLDTVTRIFSLAKNSNAVISDTVGFLYELPPDLIEAFKATLEELDYADLIIHVVDSHSQDISRLMQSVNSILKELGLGGKPTMLTFNKIDLLPPQELEYLKNEYPEAVFVSGLDQTNIDLFKQKISEIIDKDMTEAIFKLPFSQMETVKDIHRHCQVLKVTYQTDDAIYWVKLPRPKLAYFDKIVVKELKDNR